MSEKLTDYFAESELITDFGEIHPVEMKNYDEFMEKANVITINFDHFREFLNEIKKENGDISTIKLLDLIFWVSNSDEGDQTVDHLCSIFSIVGGEPFYCLKQENSMLFHNEKEDRIVHRDNYEEIRKVIMDQNLIFEPKVYESKIKQMWAEKVLQARAQSGVDIDIEDYLTTLAVAKGKDPWEFKNYTVYQVKVEFARIGKFKTYDTNLAMIGHSDKIGKEHYAEKTDVRKSPYDDVFVNDSKLKSLKGSIGDS